MCYIIFLPQVLSLQSMFHTTLQIQVHHTMTLRFLRSLLELWLLRRIFVTSMNHSRLTHAEFQIVYSYLSNYFFLFSSILIIIIYSQIYFGLQNGSPLDEIVTVLPRGYGTSYDLPIILQAGDKRMSKGESGEML